MVADDGHGVCDILYPGCTRSGASRHEFEVLHQHLSTVFTNGETIRVGGAKRTIIEFDKHRNEALTDTAMEIYKGLLGIFGVKEYKDAKGPCVVRRSYFWSIDLRGWIAFEDRLALKHDLKPIHTTKSAHSGSPRFIGRINTIRLFLLKFIKSDLTTISVVLPYQ